MVAGEACCAGAALVRRDWQGTEYRYLVLFTNGFPQTGPILSPCITAGRAIKLFIFIGRCCRINSSGGRGYQHNNPPLRRPLQYFKFIDLMERYRRTSPISELNLWFCRFILQVNARITTEAVNFVLCLGKRRLLLLATTATHRGRSSPAASGSPALLLRFCRISSLAGREGRLCYQH